MTTRETDVQERLFDYEIIHSFIEIEEAEDEHYRDFVLWLEYHHRDQARTLWNRFQRYLGAREML